MVGAENELASQASTLSEVLADAKSTQPVVAAAEAAVRSKSEADLVNAPDHLALDTSSPAVSGSRPADITLRDQQEPNTKAGHASVPKKPVDPTPAVSTESIPPGNMVGSAPPFGVTKSAPATEFTDSAAVIVMSASTAAASTAEPTAEVLRAKPVVLILCGVPGSGKSTFCAALKAAGNATWVRVNQDSINNGRYSKTSLYRLRSFLKKVVLTLNCS